MIDSMAPVTILSQFFQKENVDVALIKVMTNLIHSFINTNYFINDHVAVVFCYQFLFVCLSSAI